MTIRLFALVAAGLLLSSVAQADMRARTKPRVHRAEVVDPINLPPGWAWPPTAAMIETGERCLSDLDRLGVNYRVVLEPVGKIATPVVVQDMMFGGVKLRPLFNKRNVVMDCHLARSFAAHGYSLVLAGIREVRFSSIYANRRARLKGLGRRVLSRHALGLGIDIRAVVTFDGRVRNVRRHYRSGDRVLPMVEQLFVASGAFRAVVSPANDRAHVNHFHLSARMDIVGAERDNYVEPDQLLATARQKRAQKRRERVERRRAAMKRRRAAREARRTARRDRLGARHARDVAERNRRGARAERRARRRARARR